MLIEDPRGRRWSVRRRWLGLRRPRWRSIEDPSGRPTPTERLPGQAPSPGRRTTQAILGCVVALLWLGGAGSLVAFALAAVVRRAPESGPWARRVAVLAIVLGIAGVLLTALVVLGAVSEHHRVA